MLLSNRVVEHYGKHSFLKHKQWEQRKTAGHKNEVKNPLKSSEVQPVSHMQTDGNE